MKILVAINTLTSVSQPAYSNHCQFWYRMGKMHPEIEFILNNPLRMSIDNMRNMTAAVALKNDVDYILFIDDDILVPFDCLAKLLACKADIAAGWTIIRGYPYKNMFFKYSEEDKNALLHYDKPVIPDTGIIECDAVGFSCCLIDMKLLRKVSAPYFITGPFNTEDIYFCIKAKKEHPETRIVVDATIITQHLLGYEFISPINREAYKKYMEETNPKLLDWKEPEHDPEEAKKLAEDGDMSYEDLVNAEVINRP